MKQQAKVINFVLFQGAWWLTLLSVDHFTGPQIFIFQLLFLALHLMKFSLPKEWMFILKISIFGYAADIVSMWLGLLELTRITEPWHSLWLLGLWFLFSTTLLHSLSWLLNYKKLGLLLMFLGGPSTYFFASKSISSLRIPEPIVQNLFLYGIVWIIITLFIYYIHYKIFTEKQESKMELRDKFVLITGASRGIGNAVAEKLAKKNCHLILVSRSFEEGTVDKFKKLGAPSVYLVESDLSLESGGQKVLDYIDKQNLNVDVLFNNAGQLTGGLLEKQSMADIRKMLRVNVEALIELTHGLLPKMLQRKQGLIVNNSSVSGKMFFPCASTYAASKAAVVAFTESMSQELAGTGVKTLLLITPGIKTKMYDDIYKLYGENLDLKFLNHISAEEWAEKIVEAMELDKQTLWPSGSNAIGVLVGHHMPGLFARVVRNSFKR